MLVAEDRDEDVEILRLACERAKVSLPLHFVRNGEEAIEYLKGEGRFADRSAHPFPKMLLLDLNMPLRNGFEVLEWLRLQPGLRRMLVIIFTSSELPEDINRAFELGANSYLVKPVDLHKLEETARYLEGYWLNLNQFPDCAVSGELQGASVRVLLRSPETHQYFLGPGDWTDDPRQALDFEQSERAAQCALGMSLGRFEIVVELDDGLESGAG
jgi:CheY-like chemotaxis protein